MDLYEFAQNVEEWRSRVAILLQQADSVQHFAHESNQAQAPDSIGASVESWEFLSSQPEELMQAYEKLSIASEELHVAQEHLLQQNEELEQKNEKLVIAQQIAEAECHRYQQLFEFAPDGYLVTNVQGTIQEANHAAADLLNLSQMFLVGKSLVNFVTAQERRIFESQLNIASKGDGVRAWEVSLQPRKFCYVDVAIKVASVRDKQGKVVALRWLLRDITERKEAELALQRANEQLTIEISERQKAEALAREALKTEKELSELKSRFIAMISHEYRTPLTTILSSAEFLEHYSNKLTDEKKCQHLKRIQASVSHLTQLVNDALFINQVEVQAVEIQRTLLNLSAFCQELVEDLMLTVEPQHTIIFESEGNSTEVYLDPKLLRQILSNLLSNAIKYSPQGGMVWFSYISNADEVTFRIRDEGIGIPTEDLPQLMQSFYRATNVKTIPGTGLGLAIVKKCLDLQGGQISVDSKIGMGTTFKVTLPLR